MGFVLADLYMYFEVWAHHGTNVPSIECILMLLYDVSSVVSLADEGVGKIDNLIEVTFVHGQFLCSRNNTISSNIKLLFVRIMIINKLDVLSMSNLNTLRCMCIPCLC